jgi:hypothetical protein
MTGFPVGELPRRTENRGGARARPTVFGSSCSRLSSGKGGDAKRQLSGFREQLSLRAKAVRHSSASDERRRTGNRANRLFAFFINSNIGRRRTFLIY